MSAMPKPILMVVSVTPRTPVLGIPLHPAGAVATRLAAGGPEDVGRWTLSGPTVEAPGEPIATEPPVTSEVRGALVVGAAVETLARLLSTFLAATATVASRLPTRTPTTTPIT